MSHVCIKPACGPKCCGCNHAISSDDAWQYMRRYAFLRGQSLDATHAGGVFAGKTPDNLVLNGDDLDAAVDAEIAKLNGGAE
jgi:hypothetical protein